MTVSPFDHPLLSGLLGDTVVAERFTVEAELSAMLAFETALARAQAAEGVIPEEAAKAIVKRIATLETDLAGLRAGAARDGVVVPELVRQLRLAVGTSHGARVHFGATSQDVVDTGLALRLAPLLDQFDTRLAGVEAALAVLDKRDGRIEVMAHTRMQVAIAAPAGRKIASWRDPLVRHRARLVAVRKGVTVLHLGGAAGTLDCMPGAMGKAVARRMAAELGLRHVARARHSERDGIVELASWLALVTGSLGKFGQDVALAAQTEVGEIRLASGGGSSAMPHKSNPVAAETLVSLARFNATLVSGMHQSMVHENERSGAAWTLEWMLLPQMLSATGAALKIAANLAASISFRAVG